MISFHNLLPRFVMPSQLFKDRASSFKTTVIGWRRIVSDLSDLIQIRERQEKCWKGKRNLLQNIPIERSLLELPKTDSKKGRRVTTFDCVDGVHCLLVHLRRFHIKKGSLLSLLWDHHTWSIDSYTPTTYKQYTWTNRTCRQTSLAGNDWLRFRYSRAIRWLVLSPSCLV